MDSGLVVQVLLCYKIFGTDTWSNKSLTAPFWRLYWNGNDGASLSFGDLVVPLVPKKIVLIPPGTAFDKHTSCEVHHFFIHFTVSYSSGQMPPGLYELPVTTDLKDQIGETIRLFNAGQTEIPRFYFLTNVIVAQALIGLSEKAQMPALNDPRLVMVVNYMDAHLGERVSNTRLAGLVGMNKNAFVNFFRQKMNTTPKKFFEAKRFQKACNLLKYSSLSIDHIAEQTGFCDRNHFTKAFIRREKIGPAGYRKKTEPGA